MGKHKSVHISSSDCSDTSEYYYKDECSDYSSYDCGNCGSCGSCKKKCKVDCSDDYESSCTVHHDKKKYKYKKCCRCYKIKCACKDKCGTCTYKKCICGYVKKEKKWESETCSSSSDCSESSYCSEVCYPKKHSKHYECNSDNSDSCYDCGYPYDYCKCKPSHHHGKHSHGSHHGHHSHHRRKLITMTYGNKMGHPWEPRIVGSDLCIEADGVKGGEVHLKRGHTYFIDVQQSTPGLIGLFNTEFYFTADNIGGPIGQWATSPTYDPVPLAGTPEPWLSGVRELYIGDDLPKIFYYQTRQYPCQGGLVFVHDHPPCHPHDGKKYEKKHHYNNCDDKYEDSCHSYDDHCYPSDDYCNSYHHKYYGSPKKHSKKYYKKHHSYDSSSDSTC